VTTAATSTAGSSLASPQVLQFIAAAGAGPGTFSGGSDPVVGANSGSVAVGDVDGDGDLDLLTALYSGSVSVRLNNGGGTFTGGSSFGVGANSYKITVGDVDGIGNLDVLTANSNTTGTVSVRLNNGSGTFGGGTDFSVGSRPEALAVGDVDGDGDGDVLIANYTSGTVSVRLNNGNGTFAGGSDPAVGANPGGIAVGDVDGDGDLDVLTNSNTNGTVSVRLNNGGGMFTGGSDQAVGTNLSSLALGDMDGDGDLDVLAASSLVSSVVNVRLNNGSGTFSGGSDLVVGGRIYSLVLGDVDGDGDLDLVANNYFASRVSVRLNNGSGTFGGGSDPAVGAFPTRLALADGDGDGDGDLDLLAATPGSSSGTVSVRLNQLAALPNLVVNAPGQSIPAVAYNNVTVTSTGVGTLQGNIAVHGAMLVETGGQLLSGCFIVSGPGTFTVQPGATLGLCDAAGLSNAAGTGTVQTTDLRSFSDDATYRYDGTAAQVTGNALPATVRELGVNNAAGLTLTQPVQVRQLVNLANGSLSLNGQDLTLLSDARGTALVDNTGGSVLGATGTMQRAIGTNTEGPGYRHYSSPVQNETLATLATTGYVPDFSGAIAFNASLTPASVTPFPTVFQYNQDRIAGTVSNFSPFDKGYEAVTSGTAPMEVGRGYAVNAPGTALVDFTGTFTTGAVTRSSLNRTGANEGWHLLGNPYPPRWTGARSP
jgi:hypothetical protein